MERLLQGYRRFRGEVWPERRHVFEQLAAEGQSPRALVIACSDSRVDPAMIFGAGPGQLFTIRNVANLVPPYEPDGQYHGTSAALEFAVRVLRVPNVIVLGHAMCGGVALLLSGATAPGAAASAAPEAADFLVPWMRLAERARARALACEAVDDPASDRAQRACEDETVRLSLDNLRTFPWLVERVAEGNLALHGFSFDIRTGILRRLEADGAFAPVAA